MADDGEQFGFGAVVALIVARIVGLLRSVFDNKRDLRKKELGQQESLIKTLIERVTNLETQVAFEVKKREDLLTKLAVLEADKARLTQELDRSRRRETALMREMNDLRNEVYKRPDSRPPPR